jgi:hypothetical protein
LATTNFALGCVAQFGNGVFSGWSQFINRGWIPLSSATADDDDDDRRTA